MASTDFDLNSFDNVTYEQWALAAEQSLTGRSLDDLGSTTADDIAIAPLYTTAPDPASIPGISASGTMNVPLVVETDPAAANATILAELEGGAGGIVLQLASPGQPGLPIDPASIQTALDGVLLEAAGLALAPGRARIDDLKPCFEALVELTGSTPLHGITFGADPIGAAIGTGDEVSQDIPGFAGVARDLGDRARIGVFQASGYAAHNAGASAVEELAIMLASGAEYLRALDRAGLPPEVGMRRIGFELACDTEFFPSIAKLRAARLLWARLLEICGCIETSTHLHVRTSGRMMASLDVQTNMLRTTTAALAACVGGADAMTVLPFTHALGKPDRLARRVARNTSIILKEESFVGNVSDPALGSGFADHLTRSMATKAWAMFQQIEAVGGAGRAEGLALFTSRILSSAKIRKDALASGERVEVGVNAYVNADDQPPQVEAWPV